MVRGTKLLYSKDQGSSKAGRLALALLFRGELLLYYLTRPDHAITQSRAAESKPVSCRSEWVRVPRAGLP